MWHVLKIHKCNCIFSLPKNYISEEKTYEHPVGIIYPQNQPLNDVQKNEILQIIGDILDNLNHVTTDENQLKKIHKLIPSSSTLNNLNPNIEILPRSGRHSEMKNANDQVQILEEIESGDNNTRIRIFKFSDSFKQNIEKEMVEMKSRTADLDQRKLSILKNKKKNLEMQSPWIPSPSKQSSTRIQNSRMPSAHWPWLNFQSEKLPDTCLCLNPGARKIDSMSDLLINHHEPCSQSIPWCFVDSHSYCPDVVKLQQDYFGIQLWYSQNACLNFK